jgi:DNA-binding winged helix-turn-helix (wHTH) protein/tetratricopeptide (TPR) repeat protein
MPADVSLNAVARFGVFEADLRSGELRKSGVKVKIQELPFQALKLLLSHPNEVFSREDLRQALWPDGVYVDFDRGVISAINRLRDSLGDSAENPVFIETVGRRGYRWIAPTQIFEPPLERSPNPEPEEAAAPAPTSALRWITLFVLPILTLIIVVWIFGMRRDSSSHFAKASAPAFSSPSKGPGVPYPHPPANREAEEFYLRGRYYWEKRTPDSLHKAVDSFTQAIVHDPNYAPAYVGLADCYNLLREYTVMPASEAFPRALAAAKKAVELDSRSSEAHASLAFVSFYWMWDAATADREFRRAIELNPSNARAHHWYATYLECLRRYPESLAEIERAQELEPASKSVLADKGAILSDSGRQREAIALLQQVEENEPEFVSPHRYLKNIYLLLADYPHYLVEARSEAVLMRDGSLLAIVAASEKSFATGGGEALLKTLRQRQTQLYERGLLSPYFLAVTCSLQGNKQAALRYLKIAYDRHSDDMSQIEANHAFDNLRNEPAFRQLLADVGLPPLT